MIDVDLLRKDECQPLTNEQMEEIKSQFHPSGTANVNIVPYEIYDEDGVEQVVGEVRKTIDGVKKKKSVYRKIFVKNNTSAFDPSISNLDEIDVQGIVKETTGNMFHAPYANGTFTFAVYYQHSNGTIVTTASGNFLSIKYILKYTKTTDEWEEV